MGFFIVIFKLSLQVVVFSVNTNLIGINSLPTIYFISCCYFPVFFRMHSSFVIRECIIHIL